MNPTQQDLKKNMVRIIFTFFNLIHRINIRSQSDCTFQCFQNKPLAITSYNNLSNCHACFNSVKFLVSAKQSAHTLPLLTVLPKPQCLLQNLLKTLHLLYLQELIRFVQASLHTCNTALPYHQRTLHSVVRMTPTFHTG